MRALTMALTIAIIILLLANGWLISESRTFKRSFSELIENKTNQMKTILKTEREKIKSDFEKRYSQETGSFSSIAKQLETEKTRLKELQNKFKIENKE